MSVEISFHGQLNSLLPVKKRNRLLTVEWKGKRSVKDLVESLCVPHTEVGEILVNDQCVAITYILCDNDRVTVFPVSLPGPLGMGDPKFICDVHLWKLARRLRLLGFDTLHDPQWDDAQLADISQKQGLILLTRDRGLLIRRKVERGIYIYSTDPEKQVKELLQRLGVRGLTAPFTRCLRCNGFLESMDMADQEMARKVKSLVPGEILKWANEFHYCPSCRKMFWKGSHYLKLLQKLEDYLLL
ncbi:MAG: uncharacterized protein QG657_2095 [Acidobacteriota bacterium]|nr:uncharacterized protein [Acidobacteriota bacterium]